MALFLSTYINKIDKKGRVSVPAPFRTILSNCDFAGIVVYPSFINPCIEGCDLSRIEQLSQSIDNLDPFSDERDAFAATILGGSVQLSFDGEGRITLPESLIDEANITDKAAFIGKGQTFEIWQPDALEDYTEQARELAKRERAILRLHRNGGENG